MNLNIKPKEKLNKEKQKLHIKHHNYNNKGITLIALIITVVILLILAVVAINAVQGDGIIGYAKRSKEAYQEGQDKENIKIALGEYEMANYDGKEEKSLAEFLKEKDWCADATENDDGSINVTTKDGRLYQVNKDGSIEELTGIGLNKKQIILEMPKEGVSDGTSPSTTLTATLNGIEGDIKWSIEDNTEEEVQTTASTGTNESDIATITPTTGNTITVTAKALGKATITATCTTTGGDTSAEKLTATCEVIVTTPVEVSKAPFVEYNVTYTDMYNSQNYAKENGWRLQSATKNEDGTYSDVKLMSTGIPAKLYYYYNDKTNNNWFVKENKEEDGQVNNEENSRLEKFKEILGGDKYTFYNGGSSEYYALEASAGLYYNFEQIKFKYGENSSDKNKGFYKKITSNDKTYDNGNTETSTNGGEVTGGDLFNLYKGKATVRLLTLPELNEALGRSDIDSTTSITTDDSGLYRLDKLQNGTQNNGSNGNSLSNYSSGYYWLASPYPNASYSSSVCYVGYNGYFDYYDDSNRGVRPLVCLNSKVQLIDTNGDGVLEIKGI